MFTLSLGEVSDGVEEATFEALAAMIDAGTCSLSMFDARTVARAVARDACALAAEDNERNQEGPPAPDLADLRAELEAVADRLQGVADDYVDGELAPVITSIRAVATKL